MADIFNRISDVFGGSFPVDRVRVTFPALANAAGSEVGLVMQSLRMNYAQQISRLYELTSPALYYVGGRTAGSGATQRIIGPRKLSAEFYRTYGDVCNARTNTLAFRASSGCVNPQVAAYTAHFVVIQAVDVGVASTDLLINEALNFMFSSFLYD